MKHKFNRRLRIVILAMAAALLATGCSSPEEKAQRFTQHGMELLKEGNLVKAQLEFRNALQINANLVPALYGMAEIAELRGQWDQMYGLLNKVVELDAKHLDAQLKLGRLMLAANQLDKALNVGNAMNALAPEDPNVLAFRASLFYKLGNTKEAVRLANAALAKSPNHVNALVVLATERIAADDPKKSIEYLDASLRQNDRNVAVQLIKVQALEKLSRLDQAEDIFRRLIELYPDEKAFRQILAQFYLAHDQKEKAEAQYRETAAKYPRDMQAKLDVVRFVNSVRGSQAAADELGKLINDEPGNLDLRFAQATLYQEQNDRKSADAVLREIIVKADGKPEALRAQGLLTASLLAQGDKPGATKLVQGILEKDARNEQGLVLRAGMAIDERRFEDAIADLRTVLRDTSGSVSAAELLARAHDLNGQRDLANDYYARAFQASKLAPQIGMNYAGFLMRQGKAKQAEGVLQDVLRATPDYEPAMKLLAQSYLRTGNLVGAQAVSERALKLKDRGVLSNQIQGAVYAAQKNYQNSISSFKRAYDSSPSDLQPIVALVRTYLLANKPKEALNFINSVVQASPDNSAALLLQGQLLALTGKKDQASRVYALVIERDPKNVTAYVVMANSLAAEKQYDQANRVLEQGLEAVPGDFTLHLTQAGLLETAGKIDAAIALYQNLLKEKPGSEVLVNNLASLIAEYRTDPDSLKQARELAQSLKGSDQPQYQDTLGWLAYKQGNYREAGDLLASAVRQMPDVSLIRYHYGMSQLALSNKQAASKELHIAIDLAASQPFPQVEEAKQTLQGL
jgi:tetratricopeptide (TPR) repeat protein